jgi:UDP-N-acetylenolpyruvoylglucosamine reductase
VWISVTVLVVYVVISGVHGSAWTAVVKDIMILGVAVGLGVYLPLHYYGGYGAMFEAIERAKPGFLALPAKGMSPSWFVSTVLLSALGFYMWPHAFASTYTAKSESVFRKNAAVMPLYQLVLLFVFFSGFAAILQVPGLAGAQADLSLLRISKLAFPPLMVGVIGAAGLLTALVPGSMILLTAATILAKNVYRPLAPATSEQSIGRLARALVPVVALAAVFFTLRGGEAIVPLLLLGYNLVTQLFPALVLSLPARPLATPAGAVAGIVKKAINLGLSGLETLSGIPGAVGGAVFGNAGAYGRSISESVGKVEIWDGQDRRWLPGSACRFGYRESVFKSTDWIILSVVFRLKKGEKKKLIRISRQITKTRLKKYPSGLKCPGSFFKNILVKDVSGKSLKLVDRDKIIEGKIPAGYLLEEVGAKGMGCGGIAVADYHGNLLINTGRGRAGEVRRLGGLLKGRVRKKFGIELEEEVRYF